MAVINAEIKLDPMQDVDRGTQKQLGSLKNAQKSLRPFVFSENVELDPRKWDRKSLREAMEAFVRYDMKTLAVGIADRVEKFPDEKKLSGELDKMMKDFRASLTRKLLKGLEELASDTGSSKKAVKSLNDGLKRLRSDPAKLIFKEPRTAALDALEQIADFVAKHPPPKPGTRSSGGRRDEQKDTGPALKDEMRPLARKLTPVFSTFEKRRKDGEGATQAVQTMVKDLKKDKDLAEELRDILKAMKDELSLFDDFADTCKAYEKEFAEVKSALGSGAMTERAIDDVMSELNKLARKDAVVERIRFAANLRARQVKEAEKKLNLK